MGEMMRDLVQMSTTVTDNGTSMGRITAGGRRSHII